MSLDVYLSIPDGQKEAIRGRIYVRENGRTVEITRGEWDERFPGREPVVLTTEPDEHEVFHGNITHNMSKMAREAGIFTALWRPEDEGWEFANDLIEPLLDGLAELQTNPEHYKQFNPENGWGSYEVFVEFVASYLQACIQRPDAKIKVWR